MKKTADPTRAADDPVRGAGVAGLRRRGHGLHLSLHRLFRLERGRVRRKRRNSPGRSLTTGTAARSTRMRSIIPTATAAAGPIWPSPAASTSAICWTTRAWTSIPSPPSTFFTKDHSVGAYRSFTKYALLDQPRYYFPNLAGDAETGELYAWDGGDDLWVGAYQVEPMLALEDYTEWDTAGFDFESYADESLFSTGSRFHLFFGQASPEEAATSSAAKYVYKILVTFSGTPVLSSEESNLDLVVGSDHAPACDRRRGGRRADRLRAGASAVHVERPCGRLGRPVRQAPCECGGRRGHHRVFRRVERQRASSRRLRRRERHGQRRRRGTASAARPGPASSTCRSRTRREAAPVTEPVDARSVYVLAGGAVSTGENGTTAGEGCRTAAPAPPAGQAGGKDRCLGCAGAERAARLQLRPDPV